MQLWLKKNRFGDNEVSVDFVFDLKNGIIQDLSSPLAKKDKVSLVETEESDHNNNEGEQTVQLKEEYDF